MGLMRRSCSRTFCWCRRRWARICGFPLLRARFGGAEIGAKYKALTGDDSPYFVLAGNPLGRTFDEQGFEAAEEWARSQNDWAPAELAEMYLEVMKEHAPDDPEQGPIALRSVDRALELAPEHEAARFYRLLILLGQNRIEDGLAFVRDHPELPTLGLQGAKALAEDEDRTKRERA